MRDPLSEATDARTNNVTVNDAGAPEQRHCKGCQKSRPTTDFPLQSRGPGKGKESAATCRDCADSRRSKRAAAKEAEEEELTVLSPDFFANVLKGGFTAGSSENCELLATVATEAFGAAEVEEALVDEEREKREKEMQRRIAGGIADLVSDSLGWRFT